MLGPRHYQYLFIRHSVQKLVEITLLIINLILTWRSITLGRQLPAPILRNPFTPSEIASAPDDFFGRAAELRDVRAAIQIGSVAIQGPVGIGKSSLLARSRLDLEGFGSEKAAFSVIAVGDRDIKTVDGHHHRADRFIAMDQRHPAARLHS